MTQHRSYLICATQRCGSTLLCEWCDQTGVLGHPNEYLLLWQQYVDRERPAFWELVVSETRARGRSENGVFACKVMADQFPRAMQLLRRVPVAAKLGDWEVAQLAFAQPKVIRVRRRNRVRQAISRYIAKQTRVYHVAVADGVQSRLLGDALGRREAEGECRAGVRFDFGGIEAHVRMIDQEERYWDELFVQAGVAPLELIYEDFVADRLQTLRDVLDHVGVDEAADEFAFEERMAKMSDGVNERLYQEYHAHKDEAS